MASFRKIVFYTLCVLCLMACETEEPVPSSLVVEGWIDAGKPPVVLLHKSYPLNFNDTNASLQSMIEEQLVLFGRVAIFDGTDSVVLTGRLDTNYMPPYIYTTTEMEGVVGKTYTLLAHYKGYDASAKTTIPKVARFDSIRVEEILPNQMRLTGYMSGVERDGCFLLMARKIEDKQYKLCPFGVFSGEQATNGRMAVTIYCPDFSKIGLEPDSIKKEESFIPAMTFPKSSEQGYSIKLARIDRTSYLYWDQYMAQKSTQGVLFMSVYKNLPSNIENGLGIWSGFGSTTYNLRPSQTKTFVY